MWENQAFLTLQTYKSRRIRKKNVLLEKCLVSVFQIIIWAICIFWFCSKKMFHSCTDEIFSHFILWYVGLIPALLFDIFFGGGCSCNYTDKSCFPPSYPRQWRMDPFLLCLVYTRDRQGHLISRRATKALGKR